MESGQISFGAFPRCGNHTLGITLTRAFPDRHVVWLEHRITDLLTAPNCAVVVRDPLQSISSWMECNRDERHNAAERITDWYIRYMRGTVKAQNNLMVFAFDDLVHDPDQCAVAFADRFGLGAPKRVKRKKIEQWLRDNMPDHVPSAITTDKRQRFDAVLNTPRYDEAVDCYNEVLAIKQSFDRRDAFVIGRR